MNVEFCEIIPAVQRKHAFPKNKTGEGGGGGMGPPLDSPLASASGGISQCHHVRIIIIIIYFI